MRPCSGSADFNADGNNYDWPDVARSYQISSGANAYLNGMFSASDFPIPALGGDGNEKPNRRGRGFFNVDASLIKQTAVAERVTQQLWFGFFNVFNLANLNGVDSTLANATFAVPHSFSIPAGYRLQRKLRFNPGST